MDEVNCDLIGNEILRHSLSFRSLCFPKLQRFFEKFCRNFTKPSMEMPCWCTSLVHKYGGKYCKHLADFGFLGDLLRSTYPNAPTSKKAKNHEIGIYFLTNVILVLCHAPSQL